MLKNHGVTTIGHSVAQAFDKIVATEQACELQVENNENNTIRIEY